MTQSTLRLVVLATSLAAVGCKGTKEIDDEGMKSTAKAVGTSSNEMATMPEDSEDDAIQVKVQAVGSNLQSMQSQHQAYAATNDAGVPDVDFAAFARAEGDVIEWDGSHLVIDTTWGETGFTYSYAVDLTIGSSPTSMDGTFDLDYSLGVSGVGTDYSVSAVYKDLTFDDAGCASSGSISIDWSYKVAVGGVAIPGASSTSAKGTVVTTFASCDDVTVEGT